MKKRVMLVDRGLGFGGSLIVAARLARGLRETNFEPILASAMDIEIVKHHAGKDVITYQINEPINYVDRARISKSCKKMGPKAFQKIAIYTASFFIAILNFKYVMSLVRVIIREKIDIVHINQMGAPMLAALLTGRKTVVHLHGGFEQPMSKKGKAWFKLPTQIISISEYTKSRAVEAGIDKERIKVIPNPTSPDHTTYPDSALKSLRAQYSLQGKCVVSILGRLVAWKGQLQLLQAINLIRKTNLPVHVLIIGSDDEGAEDYHQQLEQYVTDHNLENMVTFTGYQQNVDIYYQISDIAAHCSIEPEPFGLVITEAMHNGCAVVASSLGAGSEIITNKVNGLVVNPRDTCALGEALLTLIEDKETRCLYSARAKQTCEEKYNTAAIAHAFATEYSTILETTS